MKAAMGEPNNTGTEPVQGKVKKFSLALLLLMVALLAVVAVFFFITDEIVFEKEDGFDNAIFSVVAGIRNPRLTAIMENITFFGSQMFLVPAYVLVVGFLLFTKRMKDAIAVGAVALAGAGMLLLLKNIFRRARPLDPVIQKISTFSYPSGHSFSAFTFAGIFIYITWKSKLTKPVKWLLSILLFIFAFLIAFSRVYLHVHYPSDVLAGFCVSLFWLALCYYLLRKFKLI